MATYIKTISDKDGNVILPRTSAEAISLGDGRTIKDILDLAKGDKGDQGLPGTVPINDSGTSTTEVWSASKVNAQLADIEQKQADIDYIAIMTGVEL